MNEFDKKINEHFPGLVVRKDLTKIVKGNAIVPTYVLEYLLGQYCATSEEDTIESGIDRVKEILRKHYVHRNEAELVKSTIKEKGRHKIIDKITVALNDKAGIYEARFSNLGLKKVLVETHYIKKHPKLLVGGVWCIVDMSYEPSDDPKDIPWSIDKLKPIQISHFDYEGYCDARRKFSVEEWIDLIMQSIGLVPEMFTHRKKMLQLVRLIPYCERNYNLIELGPKGTGKSHIYSEFSPHGMLLSGGEVTVPKLFVNNSTGKIGLVGYWDTVAFDEFAGKDKKVDKSLVDIMKNYMANKSFSRGIETLGAEASIAFMGNTKRSLSYMLKHSDLFDELPPKYYDTAFLDRLHFYIPGWEVDIIRGEMFTSGYGFIVDYLAEILKKLRTGDYSHYYTQYFELDSDIATRDRDAIHKTFSGLMKIIFPNLDATKEETRHLLEFAIEGRKRVKDQLLKIDETFMEVNFGYSDNETKEKRKVETQEGIQYPDLIGRKSGDTEEDPDENVDTEEPADPPEPKHSPEAEAAIRKIERGEGENIEFKETLLWDIRTKQKNKELPDMVIKSMVAFMNSKGGELFIGVNDEGEIIGIDNDLKVVRNKNIDGFQQDFRNALSNRISMATMEYWDVNFIEVGEVTICNITCRPSPRPIYYKEGENEDIYIRIMSSNKRLNSREAGEYRKTRWPGL